MPRGLSNGPDSFVLALRPPYHSIRVCVVEPFCLLYIVATKRPQEQYRTTIPGTELRASRVFFGSLSLAKICRMAIETATFECLTRRAAANNTSPVFLVHRMLLASRSRQQCRTDAWRPMARTFAVEAAGRFYPREKFHTLRSYS